MMQRTFRTPPDAEALLYSLTMVDLQRLRAFRMVVQTGSISAAAKSLGYTNSAVSQQVTALQRETGLVLLEKRGRGVVPTASGLAIATGAGRVLEHFRDFEMLTEDLRAGRSGTVQILCFSSANRAWMPSVVATLNDEFSDLRVEVDLVELAARRATDADIEIYIAESTSTRRDPSASDGDTDGYLVEDLLTERYVAVVPSTHPLADRASVSIAELEREPWIDNDHAHGPCREIVLSACTAAGYQPHFRAAAPDYATAFDYVAAGVGVTVVPRLGAFLLPRSVVPIPVSDTQVRRRIMLRSKRSMHAHPAVHRAVELIRTAAAAEEQFSIS